MAVVENFAACCCAICFLVRVSVIRILHVNEVLIELKEWKRKERERKSTCSIRSC